MNEAAPQQMEGQSLPCEAGWRVLAEDLRRDLGARAFDHWLKPVRFGSFCETTGTLTLFAPNALSATWVADRFLDRLTLVWKRHCADVQQLRIVAAPDRAAPFPTRLSAITPARMAVESRTLAMPGIIARETNPPSLDARLTFGNFIAGKSNVLALNAARRMAAVEMPLFNPLYLQGGTGQGKTHLLQSIAHVMLERDPTAHVVLMSAEKFMGEFVSAMRANDMPAFKTRLRSADLLMIDDLQFVIGKGATQEELLHTIDEIVGSGKRVVFAADRAPHSFESADQRLISRLSGGLVAEIDAPDLELREAILAHKRAAFSGVDVPDSVIEFLARAITRNVRELEGAFNKLLAYASLADTPVTLELAEKRLGDVARSSQARITIEDIQRAVCAHYRLEKSEMSSKRRSRDIARPRQVAMYLAKTLTPRSYPEIGRQFGGRDHSTVIHACRTIEALRVADGGLDAEIDRIRGSLQRG